MNLLKTFDPLAEGFAIHLLQLENNLAIRFGGLEVGMDIALAVDGKTEGSEITSGYSVLAGNCPFRNIEAGPDGVIERAHRR